MVSNWGAAHRGTMPRDFTVFVQTRRTHACASVKPSPTLRTEHDRYSFCRRYPLIIFIGIVVLLGFAFIAGVLFMFLVLPGKSEARRRRERRENRRRMLAEFVFDILNRR